MNEHSPVLVGLERRSVAFLAFLAFMWAFLSLLNGSLMPMMLILLFVFWAFIFVTRAYGAFLAVGLMLPFIVPFPLTKGLLPFMFMFPLCGLALIVNFGLSKGDIKLQSIAPAALPLLVAYLVIRYLSKPALPGYALGLSMDISGFATWSRLFLGIACAISLPSFISTEKQLCQLLRWLMLSSVLFSLLFLVLIPFPDHRVIAVLHRLGVTIGFLRNGWLRFQPLSTYGVILIAASIVPRAFGVKGHRTRWLLLGLGLLAEIAGAGRSGWINAIVVSMSILFISKRYKHLFIACGVLSFMLIFAFVGLRAGLITSTTPGARVLGFLDKDVGRDMGTHNTVIWRYARWRVAIQGIKESPLIGKGFGGLKGAMMNYDMYDPRGNFGSKLDVDVASGTTHNGYLSFAHGVGIPACVMLVWVILSSVVRCGCIARTSSGGMSMAAAFVSASLLGVAINMLTSYDAQGADLWFYLGVAGILIKSSIPARESARFLPQR